MSRTPLAYRPNPDGWIDTSSTSKSKPPTQRPLTALRHNLGIATPPSSTFRQPKPKPKNETPLARQSNLAAFMTPPTTGSGRVDARPRGLQKLLKEVDREMSTPTANATGLDTKDKRMEDFWMLDAEAGPSRSRSTPRSKRRIEQREGNADGDASDGLISPGGKRIRKMEHIASQPIRSSLLPTLRSHSPEGSDEIFDVVPANRDQLPPDTTPERISQLGSDLPERTPVPSSVLAMHKRLCHQNSSGTKRIRSPWRPHGDSSPVRSKRVQIKTGPENREEVDDRARAIRNKDNRRQNLAVLSDEDDSTSSRVARVANVRRGDALQTLEPNLDRNSQRAEKRFVTGFASPRNRLRPASSTSDIPSDGDRPDRSRHGRAHSVQNESRRCLRTAPLRARPPIAERGEDRSSESSSDHAPISPLRRKARQSNDRAVSPIQDVARARTPDQPEVEQPPTTSPAQVITPDDPFGKTAPRKRRSPMNRHHITPKKSRSPKAMQSTNETLFAFSPPPQPRFSPVEPKAKKAWQPVSMDAETLITWAPAGWAETLDRMNDPEAPVANAESAPRDCIGVDSESYGKETRDAPGAGNVRPHPTPLQGRKHARTCSSTSETDSLAPSDMSQSFPNFVHSSPTKRSRSSRSVKQLQAGDGVPEAVPDPAGDSEQRQQEPQPQPTTSAPASSTPRPRRATPHAKGAAERWGKLHEGILSVPVEHTPTRVGPPSSNARSSKRKSVGTGETQLKLAAFGYFPSGRSCKAEAESARNFDKAWSDEEDLKLEPEDADDAGPGQRPSRDEGNSSKRLKSVPDAPYHPALRPAGVAELERRRRQSQAHLASRQTTRVEEPPNGPDRDDFVHGDGQDAAATSSSNMCPSSSSQSEDLFPGFSGRVDDPREWFEQIAHRRSSEFRSFKSDDEFDFER